MGLVGGCHSYAGAGAGSNAPGSLWPLGWGCLGAYVGPLSPQNTLAARTTATARQPTVGLTQSRAGQMGQPATPAIHTEWSNDFYLLKNQFNLNDPRFE